MRKYVLVNPFPWSLANGVTSYLRNVLAFLREAGIDATCISNDDNLSPADYQHFLRDTLLARFRAEEVVVEAPEVKCPTRLLPPEFPVHIRLHCPDALVEAYNKRPIQWEAFAAEMGAVRAARVVSSPSYALLRALEGHVETGAIHVYKNPPPASPAFSPHFPKKERDVVFLGRFRRLKGADFLAPLLRRLPDRLSVALAGKGSDLFVTPREARCRVTTHGEIVGPDRLRLLGESRVALVLSRFENCSMTMLESVAMGTVVAGWRVGGNDEIAPPNLIRLASLGDIEALVATIMQLLEETYPCAGEFRAATDRVMEDFRHGWRHVWNAVRQPAPVPLYRGLNCGESPARCWDVVEDEWFRPSTPGG
jgi:glycosyltransferase involved in cell wall biosynthesis